MTVGIKNLVLLNLAVTLMLSALVGWQFQRAAAARSHGREQTCAGFKSLDDNFAKLIRQSEATLPTFDYYKTHPKDLAKAIAADEAALKVLKPPSYC